MVGGCVLGRERQAPWLEAEECGVYRPACLPGRVCLMLPTARGENFRQGQKAFSALQECPSPA